MNQFGGQSKFKVGRERFGIPCNKVPILNIGSNTKTAIARPCKYETRLIPNRKIGKILGTGAATVVGGMLGR